MLREKMTNALGGIADTAQNLGSSINSVAERLGSMGTQRRNLVGGEGNLPTLLRGASAALTGQVPQFRQQLMQEQQFQTAQGLQNLDIKNALATSAAQDSLQIRNMLLMNNDAGAMEILQDRMSLESDLGASSEATQQLMNLIQTDPMQAFMNVNAAIGTAIQLGIIDKPDDNLIASSNVITDDSGQRGTVEKDARGNYVFSPIAGTTLEAKDPVTYATVSRDGIPMYTEGPYTGLSVGKVGELMNQGQIQSFGDPIQRQQPAPQQTVRPPLRMNTVPDYSNLSSQEQAILLEEAERQETASRLQELEIENLEKQANIPVLTTAEELIEKENVKRLSDLKETEANRKIAISNAKAFLEAYEVGIPRNKMDGGIKREPMQSGFGRTILGLSPWVFSDQGKFDQALEGFAEFAARERLKASGEIRPTDADVQGAKRAMFGKGLDESVNIARLREFIREQEALSNELIALQNAERLYERLPLVEISPFDPPGFISGPGNYSEEFGKLFVEED